LRQYLLTESDFLNQRLVDFWQFNMIDFGVFVLQSKLSQFSMFIIDFHGVRPSGDGEVELLASRFSFYE